jgi:HK97 gp10 family phage protein
MAVLVKVEGFRELAAALEQLPKATARNVLRRTLLKAAEPIDDIGSSLAPVETGKLQRSVVAGTQLTRSQKRMAKKEGKHFAEVHVGTANPVGIFQEFGTFKEPAQPFMRPTWDTQKDRALGRIKTDLAAEIDKSARRLAKKTGKLV